MLPCAMSTRQSSMLLRLRRVRAARRVALPRLMFCQRVRRELSFFDVYYAFIFRFIFALLMPRQFRYMTPFLPTATLR